MEFFENTIDANCEMNPRKKREDIAEFILIAVITIYITFSTLCTGYVYLEQRTELARCYEYMRMHLIHDELLEPKVESYSFETFAGEKIVVDYTNICKTFTYSGGVFYGPGLVPEDAEIIAPGKDYAYLEDARYYYVVDSLRRVITVADKSKPQSVMYYDNGENNLKNNQE